MMLLEDLESSIKALVVGCHVDVLSNVPCSTTFSHQDNYLSLLMVEQPL